MNVLRLTAPPPPSDLPEAERAVWLELATPKPRAYWTARRLDDLAEFCRLCAKSDRNALAMNAALVDGDRELFRQLEQDGVDIGDAMQEVHERLFG